MLAELAYFIPQLGLSLLIPQPNSELPFEDLSYLEQASVIVYQATLKALSFAVAFPLYCKSVLMARSGPLAGPQTLALQTPLVRATWDGSIQSWLSHSYQRGYLFPTYAGACSLFVATDLLDNAITRRIMNWLDPHRLSDRRSMLHSFFPEFIGLFLGRTASQLLTYPLSTVVHRLMMQSVTGGPVGPGQFPYGGFTDCAISIWKEEGIPGFFSGYGAFMAQFLMNCLVLKAAEIAYKVACRILNTRARGSSGNSK